MIIPKRIYIGANEWTIQILKRIAFTKFAVSHGFSPYTVGLCDSKDRVISLADGYSPDETLHTLLHEIKHAHQHESGLSQLISNDVMEMDAQGFASLVSGLFEIKFKKPKRKTSK